MARIEFCGIPESELAAFESAFAYIAKSKSDGSFNEIDFASRMGEKVKTHFISPTKEEADEMVEAWKLNPTIEYPWDFGSWFDALQVAEIAYVALEISQDGRGFLHFEQLAWPSGGIDATAELIRAFGGNVISNDAI